MTEKRSEKPSAIGTPQLGLFDAPVAPPDSAPLKTLAKRVPDHVRFGTSSWTFPGWAGLVYHRRYPNQRTFTRESLREYAQHPLFRTVGIDRSYYAPLTQGELRDYAEQLPAGFECVSKVWSEVTTRVFPKHHARAGEVNEHFLDPARFADVVAAPYLEAFQSNTGPFLVEIPPAPGPVNARGFARVVERFLATAPEGLRFAFELRDRRLMTPAYFDALRAYGATHVYNYWSRMPSLAAQLEATGGVIGDFAVVRLLLPPGKGYEELKKEFAPFDRIVEPQPQMREEVAKILALAGIADLITFVLVNNKAEGSSPLTIRALAQRIAT